TAPTEILDDGDGNARGMRCIKMELGEPDSSGRRRPVPVEDSEYDFDVDMVVYAIGTQANPIIGQTSKLKLNQWGFLEVDENLATSMAGVYAGGDIVTGGATVILAMGAGRQAARGMKAYFGIRDSGVVYGDAGDRSEGALFGIEPIEKNFTRLRLA
ncbi:MAG: FAD-dependent oxidoreductase, partial [Rhodospirillaceae bacterium]|nr:FAD-dependent oxidoreductase [Rhodospirillaceae bacterium]